ncbi:response regulator [Thermodesulfobacteriota bacterium]
MNPYRIVLADDHVMLRQGIKKIIEESKEMKVVGEASDGLELLELLKSATPDMVVLDISMPSLRGIEATREIKMTYPEVKVLILSMHRKKEYLYHSLSAGAAGYCLKEDTDTELFTAIDTIRRGGVYLSPLLSKELTQDFIEICRGDGKLPEEPLTNREREVLKLIAEGKTNKEIAGLLFISVRTVQHHRANIMKKLKIKKMADLVKYAIRKGYTSEIH